MLVALTLLPPSTRLLELTPATTAALVGGAALAVGTLYVPWERLTTPQAALALRVLMMLGIAAVGALVASTGGATSDQLWPVLLLTLFAAVVTDPPEQLVLFALTVASYLAGSFAAGPVPAGPVAYRITILATVAITAGFLSGLLRRAVAGARDAHREALRHAARLSTVARGMKAATQPDADRVVASVIDTIRELGWQHVGVYLREHGRRLELVMGGGAPVGEHHDERRLPLERFAATALDDGVTVTAVDATENPTLREAVDRLGTVTAIASPFSTGGGPDGVVVASTSQAFELVSADVEAFELMATNTGRALQLAQSYEHERRQVTELKQLDRERSEFLSTVSHELRTPLTVILGLSETLDLSWDRMSDEQRRQLLDRVHENSGGLDRMITTLLDYTRLEQGRLETHSEIFDICELTTTVSRRLEPLLSEHRLRREADGPVLVRGDARLLERVLENLLTNARRHTPPGTTVTVQCEPRDDGVRVAVSDDGPGIDADDVPHLGERFYRAGEPGARPTESIGLGLALAQEVLRLHGTQLEVDSEPGHGTTFAFTLPRVTAAEVSVEPGQSDHVEGGSSD